MLLGLFAGSWSPLYKKYISLLCPPSLPCPATCLIHKIMLSNIPLKIILPIIHSSRIHLIIPSITNPLHLLFHSRSTSPTLYGGCHIPLLCIPFKSICVLPSHIPISLWDFVKYPFPPPPSNYTSITSFCAYWGPT